MARDRWISELLLGSATGLLALAGLSKLVAPEAAGGVFELLAWPADAVRGMGAIELIAALVGQLLPLRWAANFLACVYGGFFCVATALWMSGVADCGCFALLSVPPWVTAIVDATLAVGLFSTAHRSAQRPLHRWAMSPLRALCCLALAVGSGAVLLAQPSDLLVLSPDSDQAEVRQFLEQLCLPAEQKPGREEWVVGIISHDCSRCRTLLPQFRQALNAWANGAPVVLVDIAADCAEGSRPSGTVGVKDPSRVLVGPLPLGIRISERSVRIVEGIELLPSRVEGISWP